VSNTTPPPPGQDPYSQGQFGQQPAGQPPYTGQQQYGQQQYGAPAPQQKKSRTGLIIGIVAIVLVLIGGGIALALLSGGDDDNGKDSADKDEPTLSGEKLTGQGYTYELPEDWNEATDEAKGQDAPGTIDTVSIWGEKLDGSQANVIVEASSGVGDADLESLRSTWESNMSGASGSTPMDYDGTTIDGEEAIGAKFERDNTAGTAIVQIAYLTVHDGTAYSVILSTQQDKADEAMRAYDDLLGSWTWES
jgi:flagellar basal body-associated protein FliL